MKELRRQIYCGDIVWEDEEIGIIKLTCRCHNKRGTYNFYVRTLPELQLCSYCPFCSTILCKGTALSDYYCSSHEFWNNLYDFSVAPGLEEGPRSCLPIRKELIGKYRDEYHRCLEEQDEECEKVEGTN